MDADTGRASVEIGLGELADPDRVARIGGDALLKQRHASRLGLADDALLALRGAREPNRGDRHENRHVPTL